MTEHAHEGTPGGPNYTEGPWYVHKYQRAGGGFGFVIQAGRSRGATVTTIVPGITEPGGTSDRAGYVCEANAALIAAAPELLAVVACLVMHGGTSTPANSRKAEELLDRLGL